MLTFSLLDFAKQAESWSDLDRGKNRAAEATRLKGRETAATIEKRERNALSSVREVNSCWTSSLARVQLHR